MSDKKRIPRLTNLESELARDLIAARDALVRVKLVLASALKGQTNLHRACQAALDITVDTLSKP